MSEERVQFDGWIRHEGRTGFGAIDVSRRDLEAFYEEIERTQRFDVRAWGDRGEVEIIHEWKDPQDEVRFVEEGA